MNIEDIFIGAWVYVTNLPEVGQKTAVKVLGINTCKGCVRCEYNGITTWVWMERLEPIPLTTEILKKTFPRQSDGLAWFPDEGVFNCCTLHDGNIDASGLFRYVHQLQHALRLCGIDKEIEL